MIVDMDQTVWCGRFGPAEDRPDAAPLGEYSTVLVQPRSLRRCGMEGWQVVATTKREALDELERMVEQRSRGACETARRLREERLQSIAAERAKQELAP